MLQQIREVQENPDGYLDLWARDHRKSTIITYAKTIQDILASHGENPLPAWGGMEPTFGIFSHTRSIASEFVRQIKQELEGNGDLIALFPDVLYEKAERDAPRWSVQNGLTVRRKSNPKEATVEGWGLVDGQPTSKHFNVLIYDDVVTRESVTNADMIKKTTDSWELSINLGDRNPRMRGIGTRYSFADTWHAIMERKALIPRIRRATHDGTLTGAPVYLTPEELKSKIQKMGPYTASAQLLQNPIADSKQTFQRSWLEHRYGENLYWQSMTRVLLCDPASDKKDSDFTAMAVIGLGADKKYYLLDLLRDRLSLTQRAAAYFRLHKQWKPHLCGYEEYGLQADIQFIETMMDGGMPAQRAPYHFDIQPLKGKLSKADRIGRLIPVCEQGNWWMPETLIRTNTENQVQELISIMIEQEFLAWPVPVHDDGLDVFSRIFDVEFLDFPDPEEEDTKDGYKRSKQKTTSWMAG
jgi:phage terminase large subunit-like protein